MSEIGHHTSATIDAPSCGSCGNKSRLTDGREIYPHRPDLYDRNIFVCDGCGARVGCHRGTVKPLGTPASAELRAARTKLHKQMVDPLWMTAKHHYTGLDERGRAAVARAARGRVYAFLADRLGLPVEDCHIGMFDLERCRAAWRALQGVTYPEVRTWHFANKASSQEGRS